MNRFALLMVQATVLQTRLDEMQAERERRLHGQSHDGALADSAP